jgi:hypothetical protein
VAALNRALLTRSERVSDVVRSPSSSAARLGRQSHAVVRAAAASASANARFVSGSSSTTLNVPDGACSAAATAAPPSATWIDET